MRNIIDAICEIVTNPQYCLKEYSEGNNRANNMGEALEEYIKDVFSGSVGEANKELRNQKISQTFSFIGNKNNPPDAMIKGGDAIEVKKIESNRSSLSLNSSYPKSKLYSDSPMITSECKTCEEWSVKDMIYAVGVADKTVLKSLIFVYGQDYCADKYTYERIKTTIKEGIESIPDVEFAETNELGRVNRVDPLGITYLRVRGMWGIENHFNVFDYLHKRDLSKAFNFMAIINKDKFETFANRYTLYNLSKSNSSLLIKDVLLKNPNNPAKLIDAVLIIYTI